MKKPGGVIYSPDHPLTQVCKVMKAVLRDGRGEYDVVLELEIRARPGAKREEILFKDGILYLATRARAIEGEANSALTKILAKVLEIAPTHCSLVRGEKSKYKIFYIGLKEKARHDPAKVGRVLMDLIVKEEMSR
ncbi:MAG: hypothetical protein A2X86_19505 [Bdellovibrionales bacterium GWA2_49_15]|nr:MAG: hypothetical protein A2X86_19505 [Bdellovibrionales bacterium GWA2_49_15]HAZ14419.1 hypothetical protein [Bdellovibrionales bacterium]